jgi:hypothetical protein
VRDGQAREAGSGRGKEVALNRSYTVKLLGFEFQKYMSGAPKDWISTVSVIRDGKTAITSFPIERDAADALSVAALVMIAAGLALASRGRGRAPRDSLPSRRGAGGAGTPRRPGPWSRG